MKRTKHTHTHPPPPPPPPQKKKLHRCRSRGDPPLAIAEAAVTAARLCSGARRAPSDRRGARAGDRRRASIRSGVGSSSGRSADAHSRASFDPHDGQRDRERAHNRPQPQAVVGAPVPERVRGQEGAERLRELRPGFGHPHGVDRRRADPAPASSRCPPGPRRGHPRRRRPVAPCPAARSASEPALLPAAWHRPAQARPPRAAPHPAASIGAAVPRTPRSSRERSLGRARRRQESRTTAVPRRGSRARSISTAGPEKRRQRVACIQTLERDVADERRRAPGRFRDGHPPGTPASDGRAIVRERHRGSARLDETAARKVLAGRRQVVVAERSLDRAEPVAAVVEHARTRCAGPQHGSGVGRKLRGLDERGRVVGRVNRERQAAGFQGRAKRGSRSVSTWIGQPAVQQAPERPQRKSAWVDEAVNGARGGSWERTWEVGNWRTGDHCATSARLSRARSAG